MYRQDKFGWLTSTDKLVQSYWDMMWWCWWWWGEREDCPVIILSVITYGHFVSHSSLLIFWHYCHHYTKLESLRLHSQSAERTNNKQTMQWQCWQIFSPNYSNSSDYKTDYYWCYKYFLYQVISSPNIQHCLLCY